MNKRNSAVVSINVHELQHVTSLLAVNHDLYRDN